MSVLQFPRIYFGGRISWDPNVANNSNPNYNATDVTIALPPGVTYDGFKDWVVDNQAGGWNYYGTHTCEFVSGRTSINGGAVGAGDDGYRGADPIVNKPVNFSGKLVDLDAATPNSSQVYFSSLSFGDRTIGVSASGGPRMHSRWLNFGRSRGNPIAGNAGVLWQTVFPKDKVEFFGDAESELVRELKAGVSKDDALGIMFRLVTYRTIYYQGDGSTDIQHAPADMPALKAKLYEQYKNGNEKGEKNFSNPAYSVVVGTLGLWLKGDSLTTPGGRYLSPQAGGIGPVVAEVNSSSKVVSLDMSQAIPETGFNLDKAKIGPLTVDASGSGNVGTIAPDAYDRAAYEKTSGIVDIDLGGDISGQLSVSGAGQTLLSEQPLAVLVNERDVYVDEGQTRDVSLQVQDGGAPASTDVRVLVAHYQRSDPMGGGQLINTPTSTLNVGPDGTATLTIPKPLAPGFMTFGFYPYRDGDPLPIPDSALDSTSGFFLNVRFHPFDDELAKNTPDDQLTWSFIYDRILRPYDLINPVMERNTIGLPLSDQSVIETPSIAGYIKSAIAETNLESTNYMPITRDMSAGKRLLLERWADLVIAGKAPGGTSPAPAAAATGGDSPFAETLHEISREPSVRQK